MNTAEQQDQSNKYSQTQTFPGRLIGNEVRSVDSTGSTMDDMAQMAVKRAAEGLVLSADEQTAGRGRHSRRWESVPGQDLLFSVLFKPRPAIATEINMLLALAIAELVEKECGVPIGIKWPNDVRVRGSKIAGILLESSQSADGLSVIAGIGLNVNSQVRNTGRVGTDAVSMSDIAGSSFDRTVLLDDLLNRIDTLYKEVSSGGTLVNAWKEKLGTLGQQVDVTFVSGSAMEKQVSGIAEDVDQAGRLIVRDGTGRAWPVAAGEVTLRSTPS